jgi:hypothetical protein
MLLAIDEIVNITQDSTVVIHGMLGNVGDLPEDLRTYKPMEVFARLFQPPTFSIVAPMTDADTPPPSFTHATRLFPDGRRSMGMWPDDLPNFPAHKQALLQAPKTQPSHEQMPQASWIFVVDKDGGMVMTAVQLLAYWELAGPGQGLPVGREHSLVGVGMPVIMPGPERQPPNTKHALRVTSWKLPAGKFDYRTWYDFNRPGPTVMPDAPEIWGEAVSQTILLATESPVRNIHWTRDRGRITLDGFMPSSPILHVTFLAGKSISIKKSWERNFAAELVKQVPTALPAWYQAQMTMMRIVTTRVLGEIPGPWAEVSEIFFDEMGQVLDKNAAYLVPHWMGR